jgi:hypothetical protein
MGEIFAALLLSAGAFAIAAADTAKLNNGMLEVQVDGGRLSRIEDLKSKHVVRLDGEHAVLTVEGKTLDTAILKVRATSADQHSVSVSYDDGPGELRVVYELRPGWRFVSKQIVFGPAANQQVKIDSLQLVEAKLSNTVLSERRMAGGKRGVFLRMGEADQTTPTWGMAAAIQNPFMQWSLKDGQLSMAYLPTMQWRGAWGAFESDRAIIGLYGMSGHTLPEGMIGEWKYERDVDTTLAKRPKVDQAEIAALTDIYRAFLLYRSAKNTRIHVGWCENDYQIDVGTPEGRTEYKRIIDQAAAVGCDYILYAPANSEVSSLKENRDAWGWENLLWLGMGQKIRKDEWKIESDPIPASVQEMLDYAKDRKIGLVAYAYPTVPFMQNKEWTEWIKGNPGGYQGPDTGIRSFQDWLVDRLLTFQKRTGVAGYSFDHWWMAYDKSTTSQYAQWWGTRRVLAELRKKSPDIVIDGRQQYHWFGSWTWLAGTYPHPMMTDEQPGSYKNFADLHFDRVSADRQRFAAYMYRVQEFCPIEILPGYMTHQTPRINDKHQCPRDRFRPKDWDYLGWKYSVISSVGTAPMQNVVNMLPARDQQEFAAFGKQDQAWLKGWLDWTDRNRDVLKNLRAIIGPPAVGRMDGTAACVDDHCFVFVFNPNYRAIESKFKLDGSIGLTRGSRFLLKQLYPRESLIVGKPGSGVWSFGDTVPVRIKGPEAMVLEIVPAERSETPVVMNALGLVAFDGDKLAVACTGGEAGRKIDVQVLLATDKKLAGVEVNGVTIKAFTQNGRLVTVPVTFAGTAVDHCPQVGVYDAKFAEQTYKTDLTIPKAIFSQLAARKAAWPVTCTPEELCCTWLGPNRLLLYVNIADASHKSEASMKIDGKPVELKKAYSSIATDAEERTLTGFYADVSDLKPDTKYEVELSLPELTPGQFQGLFLENVENALSTEIDR